LYKALPHTTWHSKSRALATLSNQIIFISSALEYSNPHSLSHFPSTMIDFILFHSLPFTLSIPFIYSWMPRSTSKSPPPVEGIHGALVEDVTLSRDSNLALFGGSKLSDTCAFDKLNTLVFTIKSIIPQPPFHIFVLFLCYPTIHFSPRLSVS